MPDLDRDEKLISAILASIDTGAFPQSENVASAELSPETFPAVLQRLSEARETIRDEVKKDSLSAGSSVDSLISQAKQLQVDIEQSKTIAREIIEQAEHAKLLQEECHDASRKMELLNREVSFTGSLETTLQKIKEMAAALAQGQEHLIQGRLENSFAQLQHVKSSLENLGFLNRSNAADVLYQRTKRLEDDLIEQVNHAWNKLLKIDPTKSSILISQNAAVDSEDTFISLDVAVELSSKLNLLETIIIQFCRDVDSVILKPCLLASKKFENSKIIVEGRKISVSQGSSEASSTSLIEDITTAASYFNEYLPPIISGILSDAVMPSLVSRLISRWLIPSVPVSLDAMQDFQKLLQRVHKFADDLSAVGWNRGDDLLEWIQQAPQIWLARRRESSLTSVRRLMATKIHQTQVVERTETQTIPDEVKLEDQTESIDNWNEPWTDDAALQADARQQDQQPLEDGEEASAWDVENDTDLAQNGLSSVPPTPSKSSTSGQEDGDDWGWGGGGDDPTTPQNPPSPAAKRTLDAKQNGVQAPPSTTGDRSITLREKYTISGIPDALALLIQQILDDASLLSSPSYASSNAILPSAGDLSSLAEPILIAYRALAPTTYQSLPAAGAMYTYNDCIRLNETLAALPALAHALLPPLEPLTSFAQRTYATALATQRTILLDQLDGAQGFTACTTPPFARACADAVRAVADHLRALAAEWRPVLAPSVLLQALGALLQSVVERVVLQVSELPDIGERESTRLKELCDELLALRDLFVQDVPGGGAEARAGDVEGEADDDDERAGRNLTSFFVPSWIRFQYLVEILESSLADIRWLWRESELRRDFEAEEVVDLIEALFAESALRREAIAEIRRG